LHVTTFAIIEKVSSIDMSNGRSLRKHQYSLINGKIVQ